MTKRVMCLRQGDIVDTDNGWLEIKGYNEPYVEVDVHAGKATRVATRMYTFDDIKQRAAANVQHVIYCS